MGYVSKKWSFIYGKWKLKTVHVISYHQRSHHLHQGSQRLKYCHLCSLYPLRGITGKENTKFKIAPSADKGRILIWIVVIKNSFREEVNLNNRHIDVAADNCFSASFNAEFLLGYQRSVYGLRILKWKRLLLHLCSQEAEKQATAAMSIRLLLL